MQYRRSRTSLAHTPVEPRILPRRLRMLAVALLVSLVTIEATAEPPLVNPGFEIIGPNGSRTTHRASDHTPTPSAAEGWQAVGRPSTRTTTELLPSTLPGGGARMIRVVAEDVGGGVQQRLSKTSVEATAATMSAWVFVRRGRVGLASDAAGEVATLVESSRVGRWELLEARQPADSNAAIVLRSLSPETEFYVDEVTHKTR